MLSKIRIAATVGVTVLAVAGGVVAASATGVSGVATGVSGVAASDSSLLRGHDDSSHGLHHDGLVQLQHVSVDGSLSPARARLVLLRVRELYTFWDTGDARYLHLADSPSFVDHTLPAGRPQGLAGIELASRTFRAAVPDLRCTVADVLVSGDRVSVRQVYAGHFTGTFNGVRGRGQTVRFNAFDIQQVGRTQIVADWHLEDNLTFLQQIGAK